MGVEVGDMQMIQAVVKIQFCTTRPGRKAFVGKDWPCHGIAAGHIRFYSVTGRTWAVIRRVVAGMDTTGKRTMGFTNVSQTSAVSWELVQVSNMTATETWVKPLTAAEQLKAMGVNIERAKATAPVFTLGEETL